MSVRIGSNIASLIGQRSLARADALLGRTVERLASGSRINRASDDAAGLAVATGLRVNSRIFTQGIRNANDAISALNIQDGALGSLTSILDRIQELAAQSANGTFSNLQRRSLDNEAQQLKQEFERIQLSTKFNGLRLVSNGASQLDLQLGVGNGSVLSGYLGILGTAGGAGYGGHSAATSAVSGTSSRPYGLGDYDGDGDKDLLRVEGGEARVFLNTGSGFESSGTVIASGIAGTVGDIRSADLDGNGTEDFVVLTTTRLVSLGQGIQTTNNLSVTISGYMELGDISNDGQIDLVYAGGGVNDNVLYAVTIDQTGTADFFNQTIYNHSDQITGLAIDTATNRAYIQESGGSVIAVTSDNGIHPYFSNAQYVGLAAAGGSLRTLGDINGDGVRDLAVAAGNAIEVLDPENGISLVSLSLLNATDVAFGDYNNDGEDDIVGLSSNGTVSFFSGNGTTSFTLQGTAADSTGGSSSGYLQLADTNGDGYLDALAWDSTTDGIRLYQSTGIDAVTLDDFSLLTAAGARATFATIDDARLKLQNTRGGVGATMSRLASAVNTLGSLQLNSEAAAGRIDNADMASESSNYIRAQILKETAAAVLGQANQIPALALSLLRTI